MIFFFPSTLDHLFLYIFFFFLSSVFDGFPALYQANLINEIIS